MTWSALTPPFSVSTTEVRPPWMLFDDDTEASSPPMSMKRDARWCA